MKTINKWALGIALMAGLASCEMKDELLGDSVLSGDTGFLALNVATANASTKGTTDQVDDFPVTITGKDVEYTKTYGSYAELKKEESIELPVGSFTIEAHSPVEFKDEMSEPYYGGTKDITITKGVTSEEEVKCKIQNVKITMSYTAAFLETYESWTITVTDKKGHVRIYTQEDGNELASVYWKLGDSVETIYIEGKAVNKTTKEEVSIYGTAKKTNLPGYEDDDDTAFVGGDELKIEANPVQVEGSTPGVEKDGIEINVSGFDSETNEEILIDVEQGTNTPGEGGEEGDGDGEETPDPQPGEDSDIEISDNGTGYLTNGVTVVDSNYPDDLKISMTVPNGIKNVYVKVESDNEYFTNAAALMGLTTGDGMDLTSTEANELSELFPLPNTGDLKYDFTMTSSLFGMLQNYSGKHDFTLKVVDSKGNIKSAVLTINI